MNLWSVKPKARLKIGQHFMGYKISLTAEGVVLYKEWDKTDRRDYYWEEWELRGFNTIDSWIEYDHYTKKVTRYVPLRTEQTFDISTLEVGESLTINTKEGPVPAYVHEIGEGKVASIRGTFSYRIFKDDIVKYAELHAAGSKRRFSIEVYDREFDIYEGDVLTKKDQKQLLGRVVQPYDWGKIFSVLFWVLFGGFFILASVWPRNETVCTPRTVTTANGITTTENQCSTRTVYGFGSGGGSGGVGK